MSVFELTCTFIPFIVGTVVSFYLMEQMFQKKSTKLLVVNEKFFPSLFSCRLCLKMGNPCSSKVCGLKKRRVILNIISSAKSSIDVCVCLLTSNDFLQRLIMMSNKGARVRIIVDKHLFNQGASGGSQVRAAIVEANIQFKECDCGGTMHNKFAIVDDKILLNGSFNWTVNCNFGNYENLEISGSKKAIDAFRSAFEEIWHWPSK